MLENISSHEYIKEKTVMINNCHQKIVIGKGGFGTVRFGLSLTDTDKLKSGEIVCIKKTK